MFFRNWMVLTLVIVLIALFSVSGCDLNGENDEIDEAVLWPNKHIEFVISMAPGGGTDIYARNIAVPLKDILGVDVRVVNKSPGEAGTYIQNQGADGHTWTNTHEVPIAHVLGIPGICMETSDPLAIVQIDPRWYVVVDDSPFESIEEMLEYAKDNIVTVGGVHPAGPDALATFFLAKHSGAKLEYVPFESTGEVITSALGGAIDVMAGSLVSFVPQMDAGNVRLLLSFTEERTERFPEVPTAKELGYDVVSATYRGVSVLSDTPEDVKQMIVDAFLAAIETEYYKNYVKDNYLDLVPDVLVGDDARQALMNYLDMLQQVAALMQ